jgi:uncharacterized NAD-dependent epimerase/dehydratase family protein
MIEARRMVILAEGKLGVVSSKTAACVIRYRPDRVAAVIDGTKGGLTVEQVLGFGGSIPVVGSLEEALKFAPDSLLIGIAPRGGLLPAEWRGIVLDAIGAGLNVLSGLHTMLGDDPEISAAAARAGVTLWDIRKPVLPDGVAQGALVHKQGRVILTVGSDCSSGKMTVAYELARCLRGQGTKAEFVATGQTGILLSGWGQAVDRVPGDFMPRVIEDLTVHALSYADVAIVEGQGSLVHPAYSCVTLATLHGSWPDAMVLCHQPTRTQIEDFEIAIPPLEYLVEVYERACQPLFRSRVVAVALNTYDLDEAAALEEIARVERATGLPATDVVRWGCGKICESLAGVL